MRASFAVLSLPLLSLAACGGGGGGGAVALGTIAPPVATSTTTTSSGTTATAASTATFLDVSTATTFDAVGAFQSLDATPKGSLYQANASTVATPSGTIAYNPRDGIFTVTISDSRAGVSYADRFQDPASRTDFNAGRSPQPEVPNLTGYNYLAVVSSTDANGQAITDTFFYQRPGTTTNYVTLAGFVRRSTYDETTGVYHGEHGVMVFGTKTSPLQVPTKGTGHFEGDFLATLVSTGSLDGTSANKLPLQWINGTSAVDVDFGKMSLALALNGVVGDAYVNNTQVTNLALATPSGTVFTANGAATLNSLRSGFAGKFLTAYFSNAGKQTAIDFAPISASSSSAGASSIDGNFYGPDTVNLGGNFRITGGVPDQRLDIVGAFTGAKK